MKNNYPGVMIVLDGGNGAGKTILLKKIEKYLIEKHLMNEGRPVICTREPGGTHLGNAVREILLDPSQKKMGAITELLLLNACRYQHIHETILPALEAGNIVLCDRFVSSTYAFQQYGRGISSQLIEQLNQIVLGEFQADITLILNIDVELGLKRVASRNESFDRLEQENIEFLKRSHLAYQELVKTHPEQYKNIDIDEIKTPDEVFNEALNLLEPLLPELKK